MKTETERMSDNEWLIRAIFVLCLFCIYVIFLMTWIYAFLNGGEIRVTINETGGKYLELYPELVLIITLTPIFVIGFYYFVKDLRRWY